MTSEQQNQAEMRSLLARFLFGTSMTAAASSQLLPSAVAAQPDPLAAVLDP